VTAGAAAIALTALFRRRLPRTLRRAGSAAIDGVYAVLRRPHSGHVGDYVTWLVLGTGAIVLIAVLTMRG
jgi:hypothetical protein